MSFIHKHPENGWQPCRRQSEESRCPFGGEGSHINLEEGVDPWAASERMNEYEGLNDSLKGKKKGDKKESKTEEEPSAEDTDDMSTEEPRKPEPEQPAPEPEKPEQPEETKEDTQPKKKVRYSFVKAFKEEQQKFEHDFGKYPKRFFSTDLRQKGKHTLLKEEHVSTYEGEFYHTQISLEEQIEVSKNKNELANNGNTEDLMKVRAVNAARPQALATHMLTATSAPADNKMETEEIREKVNALAAQMGDDAVVTELNDDDEEHRVLKGSLGKDAKRAWVISYDTDDPDTGLGTHKKRAHIAVTDGNENNRGSTYHLRRSGYGPIGRSEKFILTDVRGLAGDARITHKTGEDGMLSALGTKIRATNLDQKNARNAATNTRTLETLSSLEDAQREGQNFIAQAKYVRDANSKIATAFDDKKNLPKTHQEAVKTTRLAKKNGGMFTSVELDGDVDLDEYKSFENDIMDVQDKLPKSAEDKMPSLRIRKLGKHSSHKKTVNGIFSPAKNTLVLDVNTSEAFVHEYGHHLDLIQKNNASLSEDFKSIQSDYSRKLQEDDPQRAAYLKTPTEALSRGFEVYAVEKLGINNRLVNPERFSRNDYEPFMESEAKKRLFSFFDKLFGE